MLLNELTIVVVTYNSMKIFSKFIHELYISLMKEKCKIIVVDNNSQDNIEEFVKAKYPEIEFIQNSKNEGYGAGLNRGIAAAKTPYVAIMNPDVIVKEGGFTKLVNFLRQNKTAAGVSGALFHLKKIENNFDFDGLVQNKKIAVNLKFIKIIDRILYYSGIKIRFRKLKFLSPWSLVKPRDSIKVTRLSGSFGVYRRKALIEVNMFDPRLFLYFEEDDIALRLIKAGYALYVTNRTAIIHIPGKGSAESRTMITEKILLNSQYLFFRKHHGNTYAWISFITIWSILSFVMLYQLIFNYHGSKITISLWKWHLQSLFKGGGLPKGTIPNGGKKGINYAWTC